QVIRVLAVDDSAFVRKVIRDMLSRNPYIEVVATARDGLEALDLVEQLKPDVVTCDLNMPRLDGVGFVREQMRRSPVPILILSVAPQDAESALAALDAGAVDFVQKPTALANDDLLRIREELIEKVKAAAGAPVGRLRPEQPRIAAVPQAPTRASGRVKAIVIGVSTGGPQALRTLLPQFPPDFPVPIAVVLHMPLGFTALYAEKLNELTRLKVKEAAEDDEMLPGLILIAQAGRHLVLRRNENQKVVAHLSLRPADLLHRPSVDVLFRSAAEVYGDSVMGVVLTGMGNDGKEGAAWIKAQGGSVLTEAEDSCVIYGMPRSVVEAGLSDAAIPLGRLAESIMGRI
ncbi:MAG TPA: chemotaxis response regulator protein-glutamate methylesterase, partial [Verrucomicrobiae bacterium]|nr:chemotaxis response regulator protein-glutamate methylesterase [Verrucomicrobiae bacterium]